jgi:hypothetical protein
LEAFRIQHNEDDTMKAKTNKTNVVTIVTRTADQIGADIVIALQGIGKAKEAASEFYKEAAGALDTIAPTWTDIDFTKESKAAFAAAGVEDSHGEKVKEFRTTLLAVVKEYNESETKTVWQYIKRWSAGYAGSKPNHPEAKARLEKNPPAPKASKPEPLTATTRDAVLANPQNARKIISELVAGLTDNMGLKVKNKMNITAIKEAIDLLGQADIALASMK